MKVRKQDIERIRNDYINLVPIKEIVYEYNISTRTVYKHCEDLTESRRNNMKKNNNQIEMDYIGGVDIDELCIKYKMNKSYIMQSKARGLTYLRNFSAKSLPMIILHKLDLRWVKMTNIFYLTYRRIMSCRKQALTLIESDPTARRIYNTSDSIIFIDKAEMDLSKMSYSQLLYSYYQLKYFIMNVSKLGCQDIIQSILFNKEIDLNYRKKSYS